MQLSRRSKAVCSLYIETMTDLDLHGKELTFRTRLAELGTSVGLTAPPHSLADPSSFRDMKLGNITQSF